MIPQKKLRKKSRKKYNRKTKTRRKKSQKKYNRKTKTRRKKSGKTKTREQKKKSGFLKISKKKYRGNIHTHKMDCVPCVLHHMGMDEEFSRLISQTAAVEDRKGLGVTKESLIELLESYYKDYLFFLETKSFENYEEMYRELIKLFKKMHNNMHIIALLEGFHEGEKWNHSVVFMKYKGRKLLIDVQNENFHYDIPDYLEKYNVTTISLVDSKHRITGERLVIKDTENEEKNISFISHVPPLSPAFPPEEEPELPNS